VIELLVVRYAEKVRAQAHDDARRLLEALAGYPFSSVLVQMGRVNRGPGAEKLLAPGFRQALAAHAELLAAVGSE
jgi:hypothetical protein